MNILNIIKNLINKINAKGKLENREIYTLKEVCDFLHVHPNTLRLWDKNGVLKATRFGIRGDRKYFLEDIKNFINK